MDRGGTFPAHRCPRTSCTRQHLQGTGDLPGSQLHRGCRCRRDNICRNLPFDGVGRRKSLCTAPCLDFPFLPTVLFTSLTVRICVLPAQSNITAISRKNQGPCSPALPEARTAAPLMVPMLAALNFSVVSSSLNKATAGVFHACPWNSPGSLSMIPLRTYPEHLSS